MNWITKLNTMPVWKKYSQCNEEAYISAILANLVSNNFERFLVELGAWDGYHLSNTRYFIEQGFKSILIDGDNHGNEEVKKHFINKENIVSLLEKYECPQCFDLLCIDLDGNDIYILEEILMVGYKPSLIVAEFNPIWKPDESRAITYDPNHTWSEDDYYGFSFAAGTKMAKKYGYTCIFQNDSLNMYFVENNILSKSITGITTFPPTYQQKFDHPKSAKTGWIEY